MPTYRGVKKGIGFSKWVVIVENLFTKEKKDFAPGIFS